MTADKNPHAEKDQAAEKNPHAENNPAPRAATRRIDSLGGACCGCGACAAVCPQRCIALERDAGGFLRPVVDEARCVSCGLCDRVCPALAARDGRAATDEPRSARWAYARDGELLARSSSGGVFGLLARDVIARGGSVFGAALTEDLRRVRHVRAATAGELAPVMRSKYVQGEVPREVYEAVEHDLRAGLPVLFSGVACQVAGLNGYLTARRAPREGLLCVDVICHGTPSPRLWGAWVDHMEKDAGSKLASMSFRTKDPSWAGYSLEYGFADGSSRLVDHMDDWYLRAFLANLCLRESCAACPAKRACGSDLTLGDFWAIQNAHPEVPTERGVSAVIANTAAGEEALARIEDGLESGPSSYEAVLAGNPSLARSSAPHPDREQFMAELARGGVEPLMERWTFGAPAAKPEPLPEPAPAGLLSRLLRRLGRMRA